MKQKSSILPYDGDAFYYPKFIPKLEADNILATLLNQTQWEQGEITLFGKNIKEPRLKAFFNNTTHLYHYSGETQKNSPFTSFIEQIRKQLPKVKPEYNCCLANLYRNGRDYMGYHSDNEPTLKANPRIASLSFGATRKMVFKHKKTNERLELILNSGDLVIMDNWETQQYWKHTIPKTTKALEPRVNLTFRTL